MSVLVLSMLQTPLAIEAGPVLLMLGKALAAAVLIERVLEFSKNIFDLLPTRAFGPQTYKKGEVDAEYDALLERIELHKRASFVQQIAAQIAAMEKEQARALDPMKAAELKVQLDGLHAKHAAAVRAMEEAEGELEEGAPVDTLLVQAATDVDVAETGRKFVITMLAFALGIFAARFGGIALFHAFLDPLGQPVSPAMDFILTGLFIGGGSGPVHTLIRFITERKYTPEAAGAAEPETAKPATKVLPIQVVAPEAPGAGGVGVAVKTDVSTWVDMPYEPIDVKVLEGVHRRSGRPNLIVYHHTAMHLNSTFDDVVRVIKDRKTSSGKRWLTGYHSVVTADGNTHAFCRWDRYGNHALGYNDRSLGVTLNGNFETLERNKWSNYNGAYGPARPTAAQLQSAARVVALWCLLYDIPLDFQNKIIPHNQVAKKACPGSNFPYAEFKHLVTDYHTKWQASPAAMDGIRAFAQKPLLGVA